MPAPPPVHHDPCAAAERAAALAEELGFALVGVCDARPTDHAEVLRDWLAAGKHGEMAYLADQFDERLSPERLQPGARSVLVVGDAYAAGAVESGAWRVEGAPSERSTLHPLPSTAADVRGRVARYAWGDDYHKVTKKRLHRLCDALDSEFPGHAFRTAVDTAPALEREHATRAGLGWIGKNSMLIHPRHGSYFLLGVVVTTLELQASDAADWPRRTVPPTDHCGTCTRCIDACPTGCIETDPSASAGGPSEADSGVVSGGGPRTIDASRCISYLTLEHRSAIDPALHPGMGDWIAGCDVCQEVCPYNSGSRAEQILPMPERFKPRERFVRGLPLLEVLNWTEEDRREAFQASALKRIKLDMLKRNALIALGNRLMQRPDDAARERIGEIAGDDGESELVRVTARQVLARLADRRP